MDYSTTETIRLDIWLWRARFVKTRALSSKLIAGGKVRITRAGETQRTRKSNVIIRTGDIVTLNRPHGLIVAKMLTAGERRGPVAEAQTLYDLMPESQLQPSQMRENGAHPDTLTNHARPATSDA